MIFPRIAVESIVQVADKTRLDATGSFVSKDNADITMVEIKPIASGTFIDVTGTSSDDWYLDWEYAVGETVTVEVRVTDSLAATSTKTETITILTVVEDYLFSNDSQLVDHEDDILDYVRNGRDSFLDKHRLAQTRVLAYLDEKRIWKFNNERLTKVDIVDIVEVREWSKFETLVIIFEALSNAIDDVFSAKAEKYRGMRDGARDRAALRVDLNGDGELNIPLDMRSMGMVRR